MSSFIDECFLDFDGVREDLVDLTRRMRGDVLQQTGIPCCVGLGPTKTLAKLANHIAKTAERKPGTCPAELAQVCNLGGIDAAVLRSLLEQTDVGEVWGVGPRIATQLKAAGVKTVAQLMQLDLGTVRKRFSVVLERTALELRGTACLGLEDVAPNKQQIMCSRSFGQAILDLENLIEAVSTFASRGAEKLRRQGSLAAGVMVYLRTNPFRQQDPQYSRTVTVPLLRPTDDTHALVQSAIQGLKAVFKPGFRYAKAGVTLVDLQPATFQQQELALSAVEATAEAPEGRDRQRLMSVLDAVNGRYGRGALTVGSSGARRTDKAWTMRQERRTPRYTTCWEEVPIAKA